MAAAPILMWIPDFIVKIIGRRIEGKLDLQEGKMPETKPWYQSKTIWTSIVVSLIGIYNAIGVAKGLPPIPEWIYTLLGAIGIYTRATATTTITAS